MNIKKYNITISPNDKFIDIPLDLTAKPVDNYEKVDEFINNEVKKSINSISNNEKEEYSPFKMNVWNLSVNKTVGYGMNVTSEINGVNYNRNFLSTDDSFGVVTGICSMLSAITKSEIINSNNFIIKDFYQNINSFNLSANPGIGSDYINFVAKNIETYVYSYKFKFYSYYYGFNTQNITNQKQLWYNTDWTWAGFDVTNEGKKNKFRRSKFLLEFFDTNDSKNNTRIGYITLPVNTTSSDVTITSNVDLGYYYYFDRDISKIPNNGLVLYMRGSFLNAKNGKVQRFMNVKYDIPKAVGSKVQVNGNVLSFTNFYGVLAIQTITPHNLKPNDYFVIEGTGDERVEGQHRVDSVFSNTFFITSTTLKGVSNTTNPNIYIQKYDFLTSDDYKDSMQYFKIKLFKDLTYKIYGLNDEPLDKITFREIYFT